MSSRERHVRAVRAPFNYNPSMIWIQQWEVVGDKVFIPKTPVEMVEHKHGYTVKEPSITLDLNEAQKLMDDLWECGLRPSEGSGSAGALRATQNHLADMKTIAYKLLKIEKEQK